jgi:hypothetical protein
VGVGTEVDVRYAMSGDARLALRVRPGGPHSIVWVGEWATNQDLDLLLESEALQSVFLDRLSPFATVVSYDARGTGLSDPVSLAELPTLEGWVHDLYRGGDGGRTRRCCAVWTGHVGASGGAVRRDPSRMHPRPDPVQLVRGDSPIRRLRRRSMSS